MRRSTSVLAILTITAATAGAQNPPARAGAIAGERSAQMLLARSAELELTDAQVVKLAGIARRGEARRKVLRANADSGRMRFMQPGDSVARRNFMQKMQADMTKERDQARVDLRDAIATLSADQQAKAWEMNAARGAMRGGMRGAARGGARGGMGARRGGMPGMGAGRRGGQRFPDDMGPGGGMPGMPGARGGRGGQMPDMPGAAGRRMAPRRPMGPPEGGAPDRIPE